MDGSLRFGPHPSVDLNRPNTARVYDRLLGGGHNFPADRKFAAELGRRLPDAGLAARHNRMFQQRAVHRLVDQGIRQFLDLGSGMPTVGNLHETVERRAMGCTVVYVDNDPVVNGHAHLMVDPRWSVAMVRADLRDVDGVLSDPVVAGMLDFEQPIAVLMCAVLHFIPDEDNPAGVVRNYLDAICPGSYLAVSHLTGDHYPAEVAAAAELYRDAGISVTAREYGAVTELFTGLDLLPPGVVLAGEWRPEYPADDDPRLALSYAGLGFKAEPAPNPAAAG